MGGIRVETNDCRNRCISCNRRNYNNSGWSSRRKIINHGVDNKKFKDTCIIRVVQVSFPMIEKKPIVHKMDTICKQNNKSTVSCYYHRRPKYCRNKSI